MSDTSRYPVEPAAGSPVFANLIAVTLRRRNPRYPPLYEYHGWHPLVPDAREDSRILVFMVDESPECRIALQSLANTAGTNNGSGYRSTRGLFRLRPGDVVLARAVEKGGDATKDVVMIAIPPRMTTYPWYSIPVLPHPPPYINTLSFEQFQSDVLSGPHYDQD